MIKTLSLVSNDEVGTSGGHYAKWLLNFHIAVSVYNFFNIASQITIVTFWFHTGVEMAVGDGGIKA